MLRDPMGLGRALMMGRGIGVLSLLINAALEKK